MLPIVKAKPFCGACGVAVHGACGGGGVVCHVLCVCVAGDVFHGASPYMVCELFLLSIYKYHDAETLF